jgi:hypothetical protein
MATVDLRLTHDIPIKERLHLRLIAEGFDIKSRQFRHDSKQ